jgi:molybdopterin/thiamine biosynthesis adenylyltransferase
MHPDEKQIALESLFASLPDRRITIQQAREFAARTSLPLKEIEKSALARGIIPIRYDRNIGSLGIDGQIRLLDACVLVIGLGGLGGFLIEHLARLGLGTIRAADPESFDETNLNRQILAEEETLGQEKASVAAKHIAAVNPAVRFEAFPTSFDDLPRHAWTDNDVVFDCLDDIPARSRLAERCAEHRVPMIHAAIAGWSCQVAVIRPGDNTLEKIYRLHKDPAGIEKQTGNLPFTAATAAALMAARAVKILIAANQPPDTQITFFDLLTNDHQNIVL